MEEEIHEEDLTPLKPEEQALIEADYTEPVSDDPIEEVTYLTAKASTSKSSFSSSSSHASSKSKPVSVKPTKTKSSSSSKPKKSSGGFGIKVGGAGKNAYKELWEH